MSMITLNESIPIKGRYDIIVCGAGVAGVAAAVTGARAGKRVLLVEKSAMLGGLATLGLINLFVAMCNGRGKQIIKGMADELFWLSVKHSWDTIPSDWANGEPTKPTTQRMVTRYSPSVFALELTELVVKSGVELYFDCNMSTPVMEKGHCRGVVLESKSGREFYECDVAIDATGDADLAYRAGIPCVQGGNYFTYGTHKISFDSISKALELGDIGKAIAEQSGGNASLYGERHPEGMELFTGTTVENVSKYLIMNQRKCLSHVVEWDRKKETLITLPGMAQLRTTRHIDADYTLKVEDAYKHFDDSVSAICDFDHRDILYEVPLRCLTKRGYDNILAVGRCASATGYAWDVLRVIPPAIVTGQAAGQAASNAIDEKCAVCDVDISKLQNDLEGQNMMIHFDDSLVPSDTTVCEKSEDIGHN